VVLPSPNGSHCSALAAGLGVAVVGGALSNAGAVARWLLEETAGNPPRPIAVVPCGERWPDGSLRPAVEDLIGAGAIVAALCAGEPGRTVSPEAAAAGAAFLSARADLQGALAGATSGCELHVKGLGDDIEWAAALDVSWWVPVLGADGAYAGISRPG
jgi:2-phosphosulfolactate phosphatase